MTNISCKVQENFLPRYFVKNFPAAVLLVLQDIFQHWLGESIATPADKKKMPELRHNSAWSLTHNTNYPQTCLT
jgi:hypothetical protein